MSDEAMSRASKDGSAARLLLLWQEAQRARASEGELLEALREALRQLEDEHPDTKEWDATAEKVRAAIAKAKWED